VTAVAELLEYLTDEERAELDTHLLALGEPIGTAKSFRDFVSETNPRYRWYPHCVRLADALQAVADDEIRRLMVFMPPRHGKTEQVSRRFPAYYLRKHPARRVGLASYEATLAQSFSRVARDAFTMDGGNLRGDSKAVDWWETTQGGGMWACGVGGALTGKGADVLIVDDPVKNDEEARSETMQEKSRSWYDATFSTRLDTNHGAIVVVQTRWDQNDLSGYLLEKESLEAEGWTILDLSAIALPEQERNIYPDSCTLLPDWRTPGEALCPERFDETALAKINNRIGSYYWSALYQQRPTPAEGGTIKRGWWKYYDRAPETFTFICQSWDMAFKDTDTSDYVVGQVWGVNGPNAYLLDQVRGRMDFPTTVMAVKAMTAKWPKANVTLVEDAANGVAVIQSLRQKCAAIVPVKPLGGKESRAAAIAPLIESGNVFLPVPEIARWVGDFVEEASAFPNGTNDDQVDAMTQALAKLSPMMRRVVEEKQPNPDELRDRAPSFDFQRKKLVTPKDKFYGEDRERKPNRLTRPMRMPRSRV
jgi:predicted phage terminase large subunit-like protein